MCIEYSWRFLNNDRMEFNVSSKEIVDRSAIALLLVLCVLWGLQQVTIKITLDSVTPIMQAALRSIGAVFLLVIWMRWKKIAIWQRDGAEGWGLLAGLFFSAEFALLYWSLEYTTASRAIVFLYLSPFVVALGMHLLVPGERFRLLQIIGLCCAFSGILIAFMDESSNMPSGWIGDLMAIVAAIFWGGMTIVVKATPQRILPAEKVLLYQLGVSAFLLPLFSLLSGEAGIIFIDQQAILALMFQAIVIAFISYVAWYWLIHHYPASKITPFGFFTPLFGVIFGYLFLNEPISTSFILALGLVAFGIFLVNKRT